MAAKPRGDWGAGRLQPLAPGTCVSLWLALPPSPALPHVPHHQHGSKRELVLDAVSLSCRQDLKRKRAPKEEMKRYEVMHAGCACNSWASPFGTAQCGA